MPTKNLYATLYITSKLAGLQGEELREKQAQLQELLNTTNLQQQAMEPNGEASSMRHDHCLVVTGQNKPQAQQASSPNQGRAEHSQSNFGLDILGASIHLTDLNVQYAKKIA
jgi:hypothetical protein